MPKDHKNRGAKNLAVVKREWQAWYEDQKWNVSRITWRSLDPLAENNLVHLGVAMISTTYQKLPRTLTYLTVLTGVYFAIGALHDRLV